MNRTIPYILATLTLLLLAACSTTQSLEEGETLYTGMKKIRYENHDLSENFISTQEELEAALACPPNGALFGSSYYRTIPYALWIHNAFHDSQKGIGHWVSKTFGHAPVLLDDANPEMRSSVATSILANNGYFRGDIDYDIINGKVGTTHHDSVPRPLTAKIAYKINFGPLFTLDSIRYSGFTDDEMQIIRQSSPYVKRGDAFSISALDMERKRIYSEFRNNGFYYFQPSYIKYLADTLQVAEKVQLRICKVDSLPEEASQRWKIGNRTIRIRRTMLEPIDSVMTYRNTTYEFGGKKSPLRPRTLNRDIRLRKGRYYSEADQNELMTRLSRKGIFSSTNITFTPDTTDHDQPTLDMLVDCTLDKPYDFALSANFTNKTSGRSGPGVGMSFAKRNAFRGGELLSFNLNASADFQVGGTATESKASYDIKADVTLDMPRLLLPNFIRGQARRPRGASTTFRTAFETVSRPGYYRRNIFSNEVLYSFSNRRNGTHTIAPLIIDYSFLAEASEEYYEMSSLYSIVSLQDILAPKMRYTYSYVSPASHRNPIKATLSVTESGNVTSLIFMACGKSWNEQGKKLLKTRYSQFLKFDAEWTKTWSIGEYSKLVTHAEGGFLYYYGNSDKAPFSEMYYLGGANDMRGFSTRTLGPGSYYYDDRMIQYVLSNGDIKLVGNIEYRPHFFGSLYGALFVDIGNVWDRNGWGEGLDYVKFKLSNLPKDLAVDAGIGIRYDLDFFTIRLDWGFIVHAPYDTGRGGYFNSPSFKKGQCLNFAIGYPF